VPIAASVLPTLLFVGLVCAGVVGAMSMVSGNKAYDEIGRGSLSIEPAKGATDEPPLDGSGEPVPDGRDAEIRQMLQARNARIVRQGGQALDIDAELRRLTEAPSEAGHQ
jgi:hypothetical protein